MKQLFLLLLTSCLIYANNILDITTQSDEKNFYLTIKSDSKLGEIEKKIEQNQIFLIIKNIEIKKPYIFTPNSALLSSVRINQESDKVVVHIVPKKQLNIEKKFLENGLITQFIIEEFNEISKTDQLAKKLSSSSLDLSENYLYMFLMISLLLLIWILIKLSTNSGSGSWLTGKKKVDNFEIVQQKIIDSKNKLIVVRFKGMNYILLIGQTALLIDNYEDGKDLSTNEFDKLLKESGAKLSNFISSKR